MTTAATVATASAPSVSRIRNQSYSKEKRDRSERQDFA
jgi:hypothetical protein